jgi:hypothetical protein
VGKFKYLVAGAIGSIAFATGANAAVITAQIDGNAGSFQNPTVQCTPTVTSCPNGQTFTDTVQFTTPTGFNTVSAILNSTFNTSNPLTNLNFDSVTLNNGTTTFAFNTVNGVFDSASRELIPLVAGATNLLTINGTTFGDASYSGTLSFGQTAAVPEPATWALMLMGFGAVGFSMRRRRAGSFLPQAA